MTEIREGNSDPDPKQPDLDEERRLEALLRNAFAPREIDPTRHERLLQAALEDPFAPASPDELVESERLRQALAGQADHDDARLARALSAAFSPRLERSLREPELAQRAPARRTGRVLVVRFASTAAALAIAAAVLLRLGNQLQQGAPAPDLSTLALAQSRTTATLFQPASAGAPSERIDRIASARSRELRDNRYALWGVR